MNELQELKIVRDKTVEYLAEKARKKDIHAELIKAQQILETIQAEKQDLENEKRALMVEMNAINADIDQVRYLSRNYIGDETGE